MHDGTNPLIHIIININDQVRYIEIQNIGLPTHSEFDAMSLIMLLNAIFGGNIMGHNDFVYGYSIEYFMHIYDLFGVVFIRVFKLNFKENWKV